MNYYKITNRTEQNTKRKIQTDDELNGLSNAGNRVREPRKSFTWLTGDKLALNEHERITQMKQIYTVRNASMKRVKKACKMWKNTITDGTKKDKMRKKRNCRNTWQKHLKLKFTSSIIQHNSPEKSKFFSRSICLQKSTKCSFSLYPTRMAA